ncbi:hypothetical protein [Roseimicrobium sp. ORNL1]|uniref:hypothetical protein n=1 Tax=Roseimicrobium sp. ORNL1 TaxID=2711231 RepID=UPI0013E1066D|nr:hypothetical protein [Roseimicrobium sp. ORNL1]QIF03989.1 hypothetical protein G5S37_21465 [Roseimicrobium sp. ORNL1]
MSRSRLLLLFSLAVCFAASATGYAQSSTDSQPFLEPAELDKTVFASSVGGVEVAVSEEAAKGGPSAAVWVKGGKPEFRGVRYGEGREPGTRHLRVGFAKSVALGSVLVRGGGALSVLKPDAPYPGNLADDSQWIVAERLEKGVGTREEVGEDAYGLWVLPKGTSTRALRFSHVPAPGDREMNGWLGGVWLLQERFGNMAPQSLVQSVARDDVSAKLVDESHNKQWQTWDNGENGAALAVSPEHPEIVTLTWSKPVRLSGLCLLWTGFQSVDVDAFTGGDESVREAPESSWKLVTQGRDMDALYPLPLGPHWLGFDKEVETRALRLRITGGAKSNHPHLASKVKEGRRVWLGDVLAITRLGEKELTSIVLPKAEEEPPPIPVKFTLPEAGLVTLVIEDKDNRRVRNLVSETPFPAGENIAWWDGSDDLLRDPQAARHGVYHIPTRPVTPGEYKVRGLWRKPVSLHYEFSIYSAGKPAWMTADKTGCWMTTHTPPTSMAFVPGSRTADGVPLVFMGAYVAEGGHGLQWVKEDGTKLGGQGWVGGTWTGAPTLAVDAGSRPIGDDLCYVGSIWEGELRLTAKTRKLEDRPVFKTILGKDPNIKKPSDGVKPPELEGYDGGGRQFVLAGIAAHDGMIVGSLIRQNEIFFVDAKNAQMIGRVPVENPRGVGFDSQGRLLALSGTKLLRYPALDALHPTKLGQPEIVIDSQLDDPRHVITDEAGNFLVSDRGQSHQVKVFSPQGKLLRSFGKAGEPKAGKYDPLHINNPNGIALDSQGRLWIAEADNFPRRVSVWDKEGNLERAFYGPTEYGGGGMLDSRDANVFFYKGLEFKLDWAVGKDELVRVFHRPDELTEAHGGHYSPDAPLYPDSRKGERYFTSCYTHNPTGGDQVAFLWKDDGITARLVAALGSAHAWWALRAPELASIWPQGTKLEEENPPVDKQACFAWTDTNGDGHPQADEVTVLKGSMRGVTVMPDLSFVVARYGEKCIRYAPSGFTDKGAPRYKLDAPEIVGPSGGQPPSSGGNQAMLHPSGWTLLTNAPAPFSPYGLGGMYQGEPRWSYPSAWPGLHASHEAAVPDRPGMVVGHTRLLSGWVQPRGDGGPMFCINGNMGNMYLFTADGLFVSTLFHDIRLRPNWAAPVAIRNMDVTNVSLHDENFWPSITQTPDGKVYLIDGARTSLVRVDGLETIKRLPEQSINITTGDLEKSRDWHARVEAARQKARGSGILKVALRAESPKVDGDLNDWPATTDWASIDRRGIKANFNSDSKPYEVSAAVTVSGGRLYAAWRTTEKELLSNSAESPQSIFKTGGCLDLMLGTDAAASAERPAPVAGDLRLLVTLVKDKPLAMLYRAKVPGTTQPVAFSSPWRSIPIDVVEDVTAKVEFAQDNAGNYEISVPLEVLDWKPKAGETFSADLGVLRGANFQTTQRVYWSNKATAITADVPSEAELTPKLWGKWRVEK